MMKRTCDVGLAILGLLICFPLFVVIALCIKLDSSGPVFFRQTRMGKGFQPFVLLKFRTMVHHEDSTGSLLTTSHDPRITRVGKLLRRLKLDEFPQLLNILIGDMSFVGPRPEVTKYVDLFRQDYEQVLAVRPGLTDLASLKYINESAEFSDEGDPEKVYVTRILPEKIQLAKLYIQQSSFLFDVTIILETFMRMLGFKVAFLMIQSPTGQKKNTYTSWARWMVKYRRMSIVLLHLVFIVTSNFTAFVLRFDGRIPAQELGLFVQTLPWLVMIRGLMFFPFRLYQGMWRYSSIWDLKNIVIAIALSTVAFFGVVHWGLGLTHYPVSIYVIDALLLVTLVGGVRLARRIYRGMRMPFNEKRVLIVGAGDAGEMIVRDMKTNPFSDYTPLGFIDDDLSKIGQSIHGVKVFGTRDHLSEIFFKHKPDEVLIAIPRADPLIVRGIVRALEPFKVPIKTLPSIRDVIDGKVTVSHIRSLAIEDLLERNPVSLALGSVREMVEGQRVMVTGAGGSIGSELCRQVADLHPESLILFERYENGLYTIGNELLEAYDNSMIHQVIGDITDVTRVREVIAKYRPHVIFHAAAHKHVPLMELNVCEAVKNNILGTSVVANAASRFGVQRFVLISSDKAVNPSSVMGATKRVAELVIQYMSRSSQTCFSTVRFGNVLGSNGSVVPRFLEQIKAGGPVTVTHPDMRRYFMLIPEAVHLVLQAATLGEQGALYVLEMGEQINLLDMAKNLIRLSGYVPEEDIPIKFIGLRPGEKLFEELVGYSELAEPSKVEKILRVRSESDFSPVVPQELKEIEQLAVVGNSFLMIERLRQLIPTFQPNGMFKGFPAPGEQPVSRTVNFTN